MPKAIQLSKEQQELYNELKKLSKRANQRILTLERKFGQKDAWATRYLKEKLEVEPLQAWSISGRVRVAKSMTEEQMIGTIKATKEFLSNKVSTVRGVKKAKKQAIKTIATKFSTEISDVTIEEAESLYNLFEDTEVNGITNYIPGSDVLAIIEESREQSYSYETFYNTITAYIKYNKGRGNIESLLRKIYTKYVFKGSKDTNEIDILYDNINNLLDNATTENEIDEVESLINTLYSDKKINAQEYNYFINKIQSRRNEI